MNHFRARPGLVHNRPALIRGARFDIQYVFVAAESVDTVRRYLISQGCQGSSRSVRRRGSQRTAAKVNAQYLQNTASAALSEEKTKVETSE
jgi:hypothetical protein